MPILRVCCLIALLAAVLCAQVPVIVDTDAGSDDLMAIAFLLSRPDVKIEAITVVEGLAHVERGAVNVLRLLELAGAKNVPVYRGSPQPLERTAAFPEEWRRTSDDLPGVQLPPAARTPESRPAADFLTARLADVLHPVRILALGPLSNLGEAFQHTHKAVTELVIMGGAIRVRGNLDDGGFFKTDNTSAEWNIFHDPLAAQIVFRSGLNIRLIPLDATNRVPIDIAFLEQVARIRGPLARFVAQVFETERPLIEQKLFFAWDPLAAVALVDPAVVKTTRLAVEVRRQGRTLVIEGAAPNAAVALDADPVRFRRTFVESLRRADAASPTR
jgi:pyrimidine-specific ribonucleoside hydrolase